MAPEAKVGIGGGPTRCTTLPEEPAARKQYPIASGVLDYFPDAIAAVAHLSWKGNEQHNPGQPLHWARGKSTDEADTMMRHFLQRGTVDTDGVRHSAKLAWRALALLQKEIEGEKPNPVRFAAAHRCFSPNCSRWVYRDPADSLWKNVENGENHTCGRE
jgi:hypothetical protein